MQERDKHVKTQADKKYAAARKKAMTKKRNAVRARIRREKRAEEKAKKDAAVEKAKEMEAARREKEAEDAKKAEEAEKAKKADDAEKAKEAAASQSAGGNDSDDGSLDSFEKMMGMEEDLDKAKKAKAAKDKAEKKRNEAKTAGPDKATTSKDTSNEKSRELSPGEPVVLGSHHDEDNDDVEDEEEETIIARKTKSRSKAAPTTSPLPKRTRRSSLPVLDDPNAEQTDENYVAAIYTYIRDIYNEIKSIKEEQDRQDQVRQTSLAVSPA